MKATPTKLPKDRAYLHFEAKRLTNRVQVDYELVLPLGALDMRGTHDHASRGRPENYEEIWLDSENNKRFPLGRTEIGTSCSDFPGDIELPFRDNAHAQWDNEKFGNSLPVIYTVGETHYLVT